MFTARAKNTLGQIVEYSNVRLCPAGIVVETGLGSEVLIPWHNVEDVTSMTRGAILMELEWGH